MSTPTICYHCKQALTPGTSHNCHITTEQALTADLSDDLRDAWVRLRAFAVSLGEQRIYASHKSIMFSQKSCHFFVRPKPRVLELCIFLHRCEKSSLIKRSQAVSATKFSHTLAITHRDEIEEPITNWLTEAYEASGEHTVSTARISKKAVSPTSPKTSSTKHKKRVKRVSSR
jgi:hypothetical protein